MENIKIKFAEEGLSTVEMPPESYLLDALLARDVEVKQLCGRRGLCATCHVYVTQHPEMLSPPTSRETLTLAVLTGAKANSRLSCQAKVLGGRQLYRLAGKLLRPPRLGQDAFFAGRCRTTRRGPRQP